MSADFKYWRFAMRGCLIAGVAVSFMAAGDRNAVHDSEWALQASNADEVWKISRGAGVTVAVIDSGVDASHPDLRGQVEPGADFGDGSSGDGTHDAGSQGGHGTQVASLIAGTGANYQGNGLYGLAPDAKILPFGVYRDGKPDAAAVGKGVRAATAGGARIMVVVAAGPSRNADLESAVKDAISHDVVVVSGVNDDPKVAAPTYPAALPGVVAVTPIDRNGKRWTRAERGPQIVLAAPGVGILTAASNGTYWTGDDPAYAAAWVGGAAALVRAVHPDWTAAQVVQRLTSTARGHNGSNRDDDVGFGAVDPLRALTDNAAPPTISPRATHPTQHRTAADIAFPLSAIGAVVLVGAGALWLVIHRRREHR